MSDVPSQTPSISHAARSSGKIVLINGLSEGLVVVRISVLAYFFGVGKRIDAFFAAMILYNLAVKLLQAGALSAVFIPIYLEAKVVSSSARWETVSRLFTLSVVIGGILAAALRFGARWIVPVLVPGYDAPTQATVLSLFRVLSPLIPITLMASLSTAILNAEKRFGSAEFYNLLSQIINLAIIVVFVKKFEIFALAAGSLLSNAIELVFLVVALYKLGYRYHWRMSLRDPILWETFRVMRPYYVYMGVMQLTSTFAVSVISFLPTGSLSIYRYGLDIFSRIAAFIAKPVNIVAYTAISEANVVSNFDGSAAKVRMALLATLIVSAGTTIFLLTGAKPIILTVLKHGAFRADNVDVIVRGLMILSIGFFFNGASDLFSRVLVSLKRTVVMNALAIVLQVVGLALLWYFARRWGIYGAFVASPLMTAIGAVMFGGALFVGKFPLFREWQFKSYLLIIGSAAASAVLGYGVATLCGGLAAFPQLIAVGGTVGISYVALCRFSGIEEIKSILDPMADWIRERFISGSRSIV